MELYITYVLATTLVLILPGPTIILVISQAVTHGRASVIPLVAGVLLGDFTAMVCSLLGLGAIMATSATLFTAFKWVGALYLIYLGIKTWRSTPQDDATDYRAKDVSAGALFRSSYIVTALNPKSIAFFVAFLPQFIVQGDPMLPQLTLLGSTFLFLATANAALYAIFASKLSAHLKKGRVRKWFNRTGGGALIGAGILTASMQRT